MTSTPNSSFPWTSDENGNLFALTPEGRKAIGSMITAEHARDAADGHNDRLEACEAAERAARARGVHLHGVTGVQVGDGNTQVGYFR